MRKFTVILLYPETGSLDVETYIAEVEIPLLGEPLEYAQLQASEANESNLAPEDFTHIATFYGHCAQYS
jgi:hypothetical protein